MSGFAGRRKSHSDGRMFISKPLWNQHLNFLAEQFLARVAEKLFSLGIHQNDIPFSIDNDDRVRRRLEQASEFLLCFFTITDITNRAHH